MQLSVVLDTHNECVQSGGKRISAMQNRKLDSADNYDERLGYVEPYIDTENDDDVQLSTPAPAPAFVPRRRFEDEDLEDDEDVKDDWEAEEEDEKPEPPKPVLEPKKRKSVKQKIAEKEAMKKENTVRGLS